MIKKVLTLINLYLVMGCSFKSSPGNYTPFNQFSGLVAKFDWNNGGNPQPDYLVKAKRFQRPIGAKEVVSESVVTLPVKIPNPLTIITDIPAEVRNGYKFSRATTESNGDVKNLAIDGSLVEGGLRFNVEALASVFSQAESQFLKLKVEVYGEKEKLFTFNYTLRTPPSNIVGSTFDVLTAKESVLQGLTSGMMAPKIRGDQYALIQVFTIENNEESPIEVLYSRIVSGEVFQSKSYAAYQDLGCPAPNGHITYSSNRHIFTQVESNISISNQLSVVPIDEKTLITLGETKNQGAETVKASYLIQPKSTAIFGVYATGGETINWVNRGGEATYPVVSNQNTDCYMNRNECDTDERGRPICRNWHRKQGSFNLGDSFGKTFLSFGEQSWSVRFLDQDQLKEDGIRERILFSGSLPVTFKKLEI